MENSTAKYIAQYKTSQQISPDDWREMQRIKNEIFGPEKMAIEYYPTQSKLVDVHNIYWMWVFPEGVLPIPVTP